MKNKAQITTLFKTKAMRYIGYLMAFVSVQHGNPLMAV